LPTSKEHVNQAKSNEALAEFLKDTPYPDWRATVFFYTALHYVQSYFTSRNPPQRPSRHTERDTAIQSDRHISTVIWDDYRSLKDWSYKTRYDGHKPTPEDFKTDIIPSLNAIKKHLKAFVQL
jgi:hypothetical protein